MTNGLNLKDTLRWSMIQTFGSKQNAHIYIRSQELYQRVGVILVLEMIRGSRRHVHLPMVTEELVQDGNSSICPLCTRN